MARRWVGLAMLGLILLLYWPALGADFVGFDDPVYVSRNPDVLRGFSWAEVRWAFTSFRESNWHPLTWLSLMLDSTFFGLQAPGYRFTNLLLHWANAALLLALLNRSAGRFWLAALVSVFFAAHPQHVESVAWISERKDVLCAFFWLLTMHAYLRYVQEDRRSWYWGALGLFALGCMAKQMIVTLPCVLLLFDYWPLGRFGPAAGEGGGGRGRTWRSLLPPLRLLLEKVPFLAVAAGSSVLTLLAQQGAMPSMAQLPLGWRVLNALVSYARYLEQTFLPHDLAVFYPHPGQNVSVLAALASALLLAAVTALVLRQVFARPYLAVGWFWFLGALAPVIGIIQVGAQSMADRYMYIPHIGLFVAVVWGLADLARSRGIGSRRAWAAALGVLAVLCVLTWRQARTWRDTGTLFTRATETTEQNFLAHYYLAVFALDRGDWKTYCLNYDKAVTYHAVNVAGYHIKNGFTWVQFGNLRRAVYEFIQALQINPGSGLAKYNLAMIYLADKRYDEAEQLLRQVQEQAPMHALAAGALERLGRDREEARRILAAGGTLWKMPEAGAARADANATRPAPPGEGS